jgi:hypothetical protein
MANQLYGKIWYVDTVGMLSRTPVWIQAVTFVPHAAADVALFHYWLPNLKEATSYSIFGTDHTGDITGNDTLTLSSGAHLPSTIADGDFFGITFSNGSTDNYYQKHDKSEFVCLVKTAGNNTAVTVWDDPWTNETGKLYTWNVYTGLKAISLAASTVTNDFPTQHIEWHEPNLRLPNLACEAMTSTGYCLIYLA